MASDFDALVIQHWPGSKLTEDKGVFFYSYQSEAKMYLNSWN